ncbi:MAG: hypothetical protein ABR583_09120 [Gaiellaceae bacterium]
MVASRCQMGFGVAVSLLVDATLIRSVLVSAAMKLLGERNWYLPSWLRWLPQTNVEGSSRSALAPGASEARTRPPPDLGWKNWRSPNAIVLTQLDETRVFRAGMLEKA